MNKTEMRLKRSDLSLNDSSIKKFVDAGIKSSFIFKPFFTTRILLALATLVCAFVTAPIVYITFDFAANNPDHSFLKSVLWCAVAFVANFAFCVFVSFLIYPKKPTLLNNKQYEYLFKNLTDHETHDLLNDLKKVNCVLRVDDIFNLYMEMQVANFKYHLKKLTGGMKPKNTKEGVAVDIDGVSQLDALYEEHERKTIKATMKPLPKAPQKTL